MTATELTCILCPLSCQLELEVEAEQVKKVNGNSCKQGLTYAAREYSCPTRLLTTTIALKGGQINRLPVRTREEIPKASISQCMTIIKGLHIKAPVTKGQVIITNIAGTGVDLIASRSIQAL